MSWELYAPIAAIMGAMLIGFAQQQVLLRVQMPLALVLDVRPAVRVRPSGWRR